LIVPLNDVSKQVLSRYPLPNQPTGPFGPRTFNFQYSVPEDHDQWSTRVDHRFSDKDSLFVRFTYLDQAKPAVNPFAALIDPTFSAATENNQRNLGLTYTRIFSPRLLNTFKAGWTKTLWLNKPRTIDVTATQFADGSLAGWGPDTFVSVYNLHNFTFTDSVNWTSGRHTLSVGGEFRRFYGMTTAPLPEVLGAPSTSIPALHFRWRSAPPAARTICRPAVPVPVLSSVF
jgi:hypothetical protein